MLGVFSARATSALVKTKGVRPARLNIAPTSIPNLSLSRGTDVGSHGLRVVDWGTLEKRRVLFEPRVQISVDGELRFLPTMGGPDEGRRATVGTSGSGDGWVPSK
jgi:hypothetical protein